MTVHIDELHSEVIPTGGDAPNVGEPPRGEPPWVVQECWREARCYEDAMARRVCAVEFDD